jgi:iron complex transport system ATP-binding protein
LAPVYHSPEQQYAKSRADSAPALFDVPRRVAAVSSPLFSRSWALSGAPRFRPMSTSTHPAAGSPLLSLEGISFGYDARKSTGGSVVLRSISLEVGAGELLCVLGQNGAGKSTLLKLCAGILRPQAGRVLCRGPKGTMVEIASASASQKGRVRSRGEVARHIAYLPQEAGHLFPFTALEVVLMGRYVRAQSSFETDEDLAAAEAAMVQTDVWALRDRPLPELSGGERRRVLLAQALAQDTELVLLDEPTAGLDPAHALSLGGVMQAICASGKALVFTTHDLNLAARLAPRAGLLHEGQLSLLGPTLEVLEAAAPRLGVGVHIGRLPSGVPFAVAT